MKRPRKAYRYEKPSTADEQPKIQPDPDYRQRLNAARIMGHRSTPRAVVIAKKLRSSWD